MTCEDTYLCQEYAKELLAILRANGATEMHIVYIAYLLEKNAGKENILEQRTQGYFQRS
jgi:hypothetical protein